MSKTIQLSQGKSAIVSDEDFEQINQYRWHAFVIYKSWYAATNAINGKRMYMHRFIMDAPQGMEVDHINGDGLDNQRANLRLCTHQQNLCNQRKQTRPKTSQYRGVVYLEKYKRPWRAQIKVHQRFKSLGHYASEKAAAIAYNVAALRYFGEFARANDV